MKTSKLWVAGATAVGAVLFGGLAVPTAHARPLSACGDIDIRGDASCELTVEGGCEVQCTPPSLRAACAAELYVDCQARCDADLDVQCAASCEADCDTACELDPGEFDCFAYCEGQCEADCDAGCAAGEEGAECRASCQATCAGECDAHCEVTPPSADCETRCEASCEGDCSARANFECQGECQAEGYVDCTAELMGGCEAQCQRPEGALFCDGQFVDTSSVQMCVDALRERLDIDVRAEGEAMGSCEGGTCEASAEGSVGCSGAGTPLERSALAWPLGLCLLWLARRRWVLG